MLSVSPSTCTTLALLAALAGEGIGDVGAVEAVPAGELAPLAALAAVALVLGVEAVALVAAAVEAVQVLGAAWPATSRRSPSRRWRPKASRRPGLVLAFLDVLFLESAAAVEAGDVRAVQLAAALLAAALLVLAALAGEGIGDVGAVEAPPCSRSPGGPRRGRDRRRPARRGQPRPTRRPGVRPARRPRARRRGGAGEARGRRCRWPASSWARRALPRRARRSSSTCERSLQTAFFCGDDGASGEDLFPLSMSLEVNHTLSHHDRHHRATDPNMPIMRRPRLSQSHKVRDPRCVQRVWSS